MTQPQSPRPEARKETETPETDALKIPSEAMLLIGQGGVPQKAVEAILILGDHARSLERRLAQLRAQTVEECARVCERRAALRFEEHGYTEPDTNAGYYVGEYKDLGDSLDEEDADCAAAIRALPPGEQQG